MMNKLLIYISLILSVTLVPSFGALDKANTQWLVLSLIPFLFYRMISFRYYGLVFSIYFIFIAQVFLSFLYTNNYSISLIDASRHLILFIHLTIVLNLLYKGKFSFRAFSLLVSSLLIIESLISLLPLFSFINDNGLSFSNIKSVDLNQFKGVTGNRNITTASIAIKFPFLFYLIYKSKISTKFLFTIFSIFPLLSLFLINSRAALLSFIVFLFFSSSYLILFNRKRLISLFFLSIGIIFSFSISTYILPSKSIETTQRLASINFSNESSSQRLFLWDNALDYISNNPFIGCGIGNWKVESAAYWGSLGNNYLVPFHAHNDFLEFSTELGIIGGGTYFVLFLAILIVLIKNILYTRKFKFVILICSFTALFIDSLLNFPFERPIIQIMFLFLLALTVFYNSETNERHV